LTSQDISRMMSIMSISTSIIEQIKGHEDVWEALRTDADTIHAVMTDWGSDLVTQRVVRWMSTSIVDNKLFVMFSPADEPDFSVTTHSTIFDHLGSAVSSSNATDDAYDRAMRGI